MLREIGEAGQARIAEAVLAVGGEGLAHEVARRYATGAGARGVEEGPIDRDALAPTSICTTDAARDVLAGSRAALRGLLAAARGEVSAP
jgi:hypothetical protein